MAPPPAAPFQPQNLAGTDQAPSPSEASSTTTPSLSPQAPPPSPSQAIAQPNSPPHKQKPSSMPPPCQPDQDLTASSDRVLTVIAYDGDGLASNTTTSTITVVAVNDAPTLDLDTTDNTTTNYASPSQKETPPQQSSPKHRALSRHVDSTTFDKVTVAITSQLRRRRLRIPLHQWCHLRRHHLQPQKLRRHRPRHLHPRRKSSTTTPSPSPQAPPPSPSQAIAQPNSPPHKQTAFLEPLSAMKTPTRTPPPPATAF